MHTIEGVMKMKYEWKIILIGFVCSLAFMLVFTYGCSFGQKTLYAYQVGIYNEEDKIHYLSPVQKWFSEQLFSNLDE